MKYSNYLCSLKGLKGQFPSNALSGSTPNLPELAHDLYFNDLIFKESRSLQEHQELDEILKTITGEDDVLVVPGASQGFFLACWLLTKNAGSVGIEVPYYEPYHSLLENLGVKLEYFRRSTFQGNPKALKELASKTSILVMTNPNFFTGETFTAEQLDKIASYFEYLIIDEVFYAQFSDANELSIKTTAPNIIKINSVSKSLGLSSLRLGWAAGSKLVVDQIRQANLYLNVDYPSLSLIVGLKVIKDRDSIISKIKKTYRENALVAADLQKRIGTQIFSHDLSTGHICSIELPYRKLELGLDSSFFGMDGHVRFRVDCDKNILITFLERVENEIK